MANQKAENILNLALETTEEMRSKTGELNTGFDREQKTWKLIIKYHGNLKERIESDYPDVKLNELTNGFGILTVPEICVSEVLELEEIEYAQKPKRLYFSVNQAKAASCLLPLQTEADGLTGRGVLVGILDSGIDIFHQDFRNPDGTTRILFFQDQVLGRVFSEGEINEIIMEREQRNQNLQSVPEDTTGHGTSVAGIAAGNGIESEGKYRGVAYESDLLVVRLGVPDPDGFPRTTEVMEGLDFLIKKSLELARPIAVNMSFGNSYGPHDGNGLFERYIDQMAEVGRTVIVIGTGNEGDRSGHVSGILEESHIVELSAAPYETNFSVQIWKSYEDEFALYLTSPSGTFTEQITENMRPGSLQMGETRILIYYGEPSPYQTAQEIYLEFLADGGYAESGIWKLTLVPKQMKDGRYDMWLPSAGTLNSSTRFLRSTPDTTLTVPSTALRPISVGAYDDAFRIYAPFSGRGFTRSYSIPKPDLAAPGVGIVTTSRGGGYHTVTGTSFAAPFVTGAAALLMEWGIIRGNDPYLYGDKVKAYLRKGAQRLPGYESWPNEQLGYGILCVKESIPVVKRIAD